MLFKIINIIIDKIITMIKRREIKLENVFYMNQIRENFSDSEITTLRKHIETAEGRCKSCGMYDMLYNKHYCKICYTNFK